MDRRNSKGNKGRSCNVKATLNHASTLKADIQQQIFVLTSTLKKIEHDLCMEVDRQCHFKVKDRYYLCENGKCCCADLYDFESPVSGFIKKSKLDKDFRNCLKTLQTYGRKSLDLNQILTWGKVDVPNLQKEQKETAENVEDSEEVFEFVDSVECQMEGENSACGSSLNKKCPGKLQQALEKLQSCSSSVDSFDVIPNECCMNDSVCAAAPPKLSLREKLEASSAAKARSNPNYPVFHLPNRRKRADDPDGLRRIFDADLAELETEEKKNNAEICLGIFSTKGPEEKKCVGNVIPCMFFGKNKTISKAVSSSEPQLQSTVAQLPANALQDSFKSYLQEKDLRTWVHKKESEPKPSSINDWVVKPDSPSSSNPCASDAIGGDFYRQLQAFVA